MKHDPGASSPPCRQCGSSAVTNLGPIPVGTSFAGQALIPPWPGGHLYRCERCGLGFRHPIRTDEEYERLYESAPDNVWIPMPARADQVRVRNLIQSAYASGRVLDVGCYDGEFLASLGPQFERYGIEASSAAALAAREKNVTIVASRISAIASQGAAYDVVCAIDVIEHVASPRAFLELLSRCVAPGGMLIISTGNLDSAPWRTVGGRYWYCQYPEHISFISPAWADEAAKALGLELRTVEKFAYYQAETPPLSTAPWRYFRRQVLSRLKRRVISTLSPKPDSHGSTDIVGQAGQFTDHMILAFTKPR
jgi:SAM-dependent methyltransferase